MTLTVVGPGRAGLALSRSLRRRGHRLVAVVGRSRSSVSRAARWLGPGVATSDLAGAVARCRAILICVPDDGIARLVGSMQQLDLDGRVVLHASGSLPTTLLGPLRARGAAVGTMHPLTSFPPPGRRAPDLNGIPFAVAGDRAARRAAAAMARSLGGRPFHLPDPARAAYHLAGSLVANHLVTLLDAGFGIASRRLRLSEPRARALFMPLVRAALSQVEAVGTGRALTGPVARGDAGTVARHLEALSREEPDLDPLYRLLSLRAIRIARREGRLSPRAARELDRTLRARRRRD